MSKVLVVGPTSTTTVINNRNTIDAGKSYRSSISKFLTGSMYTIAYDLAVLDTDTTFYSRLAYDSDGNALNFELEKTGCTIFSNNRLLPDTPQNIFIYDKRNIVTSFNNIGYEAYPSISDGYAPIDFRDGDYAIVDIKDSMYFQRLIEHYPTLRFIGYNTAISDALIKYVEGVIYDYQTITSIATKSNFPSYARSLLDKGVKWMVITNNGQEAYYYQGLQQAMLMADDFGNYPLGTNEAFASMLTACLADGMNLKEAVEHGLKLASDFSKIPSIRLEKSLFNTKNGD